MKLILTAPVEKLGVAGDVVDVKRGYGRNFLLPTGSAILWTRGAEKQIDSIKAARAAREHATIEEAQDLKSRLEAATVTLTVKAGKEGRLFGSVSTADIAAAVAKAGVGTVDKRKIELASPIKAVGEHEATVRLRDDLVAVISLKVVAAK